MRNRYSVIILFAVVAFTCSDRERNNPLDPKNPDTLGRPQDLMAYSMERNVYLRWKSISQSEVRAVIIYSRAEDETLFREIGQSNPAFSEFIHWQVEYGRTYEYYITAKSDEFETLASNTARVTPGPTYTWVADFYSGYFLCLTHDLKHIVGRYGLFIFPCVVAAIPRERTAWFYARFGTKLYKVDHHGKLLQSIEDIDQVVDIAIDHNNNAAWLAHPNVSLVAKIAPVGTPEFFITSISRPAALAVDSENHDCWILDTEGKNLLKLDSEGRLQLRSNAPLAAPKDVCLDKKAQVLWIADSTRVLQFGLTAKLTGVVVNNLKNATHVACDPSRSACWIVDNAQPAEVIKVNNQGEVQFSLAQFSDLQAIDVNRYDGSCMVGDVSQSKYGLYRISENGHIERIGESYMPYSISIEHH